jgi:hypothetical protein
VRQPEHYSSPCEERQGISLSLQDGILTISWSLVGAAADKAMEIVEALLAERGAGNECCARFGGWALQAERLRAR